MLRVINITLPQMDQQASKGNRFILLRVFNNVDGVSDVKAFLTVRGCQHGSRLTFSNIFQPSFTSYYTLLTPDRSVKLLRITPLRR